MLPFLFLLPLSMAVYSLREDYSPHAAYSFPKVIKLVSLCKNGRKIWRSELQIKRGIKENSKIFFLISQ